MPRQIGKAQGTRSVSFRVPKDVYEELAAVARWRGVDLSALLNCILAEQRPALVRARLEHARAMSEAAALTGRAPDQDRPAA